MKTMKYIFQIIFLLIQMRIYAQDNVRELTFQISTKEGAAANLIESYLNRGETTIEQMVITDGSTCCQIGLEEPVEEYWLVLSKEESCICRVNLARLLRQENGIQTQIATVSVIGDSLVEKPSLIAPSFQSFRFFDLYSYSKKHHINRYGCLKWYFPTELLLNQDTSYYNYVSQWYNEEKYFRDYGIQPKEGLIDSLRTAQFQFRAECLAGWYSDRLIQLNEPILCNGYPRDVYRYTWSTNAVYCTYDPYCMRIEFDEEENAIMYCSYLRWDDCEGYALYCDIVPLQKSEITELLSLLRRIHQDSAKPLLDNGGSNNILESNLNGQYHVIFRGDGEDEGMEELREFLWGLTGLGENKIVHKRQRIE